MKQTTFIYPKPRGLKYMKKGKNCKMGALRFSNTNKIKGCNL